ncbi:MAG: tetraacyldisaccharide 4'-kinase [Gemmatimonas sp.]|nr:tetraacyldisaccharide 4'-kinase [Gemmatimonas sp.]
MTTGAGHDEAVLDLRGGARGRVEDAWRRWETRLPRLAAWIEPCSEACGDAELRRRLSSRGVPDARPFLVSVGNLVAGGTGKTPVVLDLARRLSAAGLHAAVLTRGYGSRAAGPRRVRPDDPDCGDEARLLAAALPEVPVVQARRRRPGLAWLLREAPGCGIVLLEDAHQSAGLPRHLDVLILDRWERRAGIVVPTPVRRLPWGPGREDVSGAARARLWLVEADTGADGPLRGPAGVVVLGFARREVWADGASPAPGAPCAVVSGIARPERFEAACGRLCGAPPVLSVRCADHARYDPRRVAQLLAEGTRRGAACWLTTAKDRVKLSGVWPADAPPLYTVGLELVWRGPDPVEQVVLQLLEG